MQGKINIHFPLLFLGVLSLLFGIWVGWVRIGWQFPLYNLTLKSLHGPLMVAGFLGTLISLERAVVIKKTWAYLSPLFSGLGTLALLVASRYPFPAALLYFAGSFLYLLIFLKLVRQYGGLPLIVMAVGAAQLMIGNILWLLGFAIPQIVLWWSAFLILTIAGERLELSKLLQLSVMDKRTFVAIIAWITLSALISTFSFEIGMLLSGLGMLLLALWLWQNDIARRTIRKPGLSRYMAISLLSGYFWLAITGITAMRFPNYTAGPYYDAILHSLFVGFVFSMIFGHAPVIFPTVLGKPIGFRNFFYYSLGLLHFSVLLRFIGDVFFITSFRLWGALLNGIAIIIFLISLMISMKLESGRHNKETANATAQ